MRFLTDSIPTYQIRSGTVREHVSHAIIDMFLDTHHSHMSNTTRNSSEACSTCDYRCVSQHTAFLHIKHDLKQSGSLFHMRLSIGFLTHSIPTYQIRPETVRGHVSHEIIDVFLDTHNSHTSNTIRNSSELSICFLTHSIPTCQIRPETVRGHVSHAIIDVFLDTHNSHMSTRNSSEVCFPCNYRSGFKTNQKLQTKQNSKQFKTNKNTIQNKQESNSKQTRKQFKTNKQNNSKQTSKTLQNTQGVYGLGFRV